MNVPIAVYEGSNSKGMMLTNSPSSGNHNYTAPSSLPGPSPAVTETEGDRQARKECRAAFWADSVAFVGTFPRGDEMPGLLPKHCPVRRLWDITRLLMEHLGAGEGLGEAPESQRLSVVM